MEDFRNLRAEQLGVVYQKRLELAKALTTDPKVILIDECMAGLKPEEIEALKKLLHEIRNNGVSMIVVEHVIRGLIGLCDRVVVLHHGEKIAEGNPHEIIKAPEVKKAYLGEEYAAA
jgi:branched-chain amino acid transport system ATP-binding protein